MNLLACVMFARARIPLALSLFSHPPRLPLLIRVHFPASSVLSTPGLSLLCLCAYVIRSKLLVWTSHITMHNDFSPFPWMLSPLS